jgi:hypothetical protein
MKHRLLIGLAVLSFLGGLAAYMTRQRSDDAAPAPTAGEDLSKALPAVTAEAVDALEVKTAESPVAVRLEKRNGTWRVVAPVDAAADEGAAKEAAEKLASLKVERLVTDSKANFERLGLGDDKATLVRALGGGKELLALVIGGFGSGGTFVRKSTEDKVYSVEGSIAYAFNKELRSWRDRVMTNVDAKNVTAVRWQKGKEVFAFERDASKPDDPKAWVPSKGAKALPKLDPSKVQGLVTGLSKMQASDFGAPTATAEAAGITADSGTATLTLSEKADGAAESTTRTVVVRLGASRDENGQTQHFVMIDGSPVVFIVTDYVAKRITPKVEDFQESEKPAEGDAPAPGGMPPGMQPTMGGADSVPPEIMQQLQEQMRRQQQQ